MNFLQLKNFRKELLWNLFKIYWFYYWDLKAYSNIDDIINDFIEKQWKQEVIDFDIEALSYLIKYSWYNDYNKLLLLWNKILETKYESSYYEKFKINILNFINGKIFYKK